MAINVGDRVKLKSEMLISRNALAMRLANRAEESAEVMAVNGQNLDIQYEDGHTATLPSAMVSAV